MALEGTTVFCFAASYGVAAALEIVQAWLPKSGVRWLTLAAAAAGFLAHSIYLYLHPFAAFGGPNSLLLLAWILAIFYLEGSIHHRRQAWGIFVIPVVAGLSFVAYFLEKQETAATPLDAVSPWWAWTHAALLTLSAVGVCVGFIASVMYLVQSSRLKHKSAPGDGLKLLSLERLEAMNRRALHLAFPLFTAGLLIGLLLWRNEQFSWLDSKVISTGTLWLAFVVLLYLRHGLHLRGRRIAWGTIAAFVFLLIAFTVQYFSASRHHFGGGS